MFSPMGMYGLDPATLARMTTAMTGNPDLAKEMMVGLGVPPPGMDGGGGGIGAALAGAPSPVPGTVLGQPPVPQAAPQGAMSPPQAGGGMPNPQEIANIFRGVQAPKAPQPEMRAGVSGSQGAMAGKAPQVKTGELEMLMQMLSGRQNPMVVPPLGALLAGKR